MDNVGFLDKALISVNTPVRRLRNLIKNMGTMSSVVMNWYKNENEFWATSNAPVSFRKGNLELKIRKDTIELKLAKRHVFFYYDSAKQFINSLGLLNDQFIRGQYSWLKARNKDVVDIGANIGDSAIYFALRGARHVYALEPYSYSYGIAKKNIKLSKLKTTITLLNEACDGKVGFIRIGGRAQEFSGAKLKRSERGSRIRTVTLDAIVKKYRLKDCILKMDCEGMEYSIVMNSKDDTLKAFSQIMIEYHSGYKNLENRLSRAGFSVKHTFPICSYGHQSGRRRMMLGFIFASRI